LKLNTIDIDDTSKKNLLRVLKKIRRCPFLDSISVEPSLNGWHITLWCKRECEVCRLVFDDQTRFMWDLERPRFSRNVLFDVKIPVTIFQVGDLLGVNLLVKARTNQGWCDCLRCIGLNPNQQSLCDHQRAG